MIAGLDSAYPPNAASIAAAKAGGIQFWAGYFAGPNILNGWSQADFDRVKAGGLGTLAYCSGWADPTVMALKSLSWSVPICLDVEGGIRGNGSWVEQWLITSGAGLYGNAPVFPGRRAAFYIMAAYPGINPHATWPATSTRPPGPCGWQWQGSHSAYGANVDSSWLDDWFAPKFSGGSGSLSGDDDMALDPNDPIVQELRNRIDYLYEGLYLKFNAGPGGFAPGPGTWHDFVAAARDHFDAEIKAVTATPAPIDPQVAADLATVAGFLRKFGLA